MTPLQKRKQLTALLGAYSKRLEVLYDSFIKNLSSLARKTHIPVEKMLSENPLFHFNDFPEIKEEFNRIFNDYVQKELLSYRAGITDGVALAYSQDADVLTGFSVLSDKAISHARNIAAETFLATRLRPEKGLSLSQLVWNYASEAKSEFEVAISNVIADGLTKGTSAASLALKVRQYLNNPDMMYRRYHRTVVDAHGNKKDIVRWRRRVIDENGKVRFVEEPLEKVGMGHYRSAKRNADRLMRTEINMSYHRANAERWQQEPFVIGIRIELSPEHPVYDECDELEGDYPKDFIFISWHPQCYSDDTKVLTSEGWKLFSDVKDEDKILSLSPENRQLEYVGIVERQCWEKQGDMVHFYNRNLDCLVTPEHRMVYLSKSGGDIRYCTASDYTKNKGGFYRGCEYFAEDRQTIAIGHTIVDFDDFCEFMGYYLSDGSLIRTHQIVISQRDGQPHKQEIIDCIERMGFRTTVSYDFINFYSGDICSYLRQFGVCNQKYVPSEIMNASPRQIGIFLDSFVKCDGHVKKPHTFMGNRGSYFIPKHNERTFYTTSPQMAGNLSELLLKIGHRPSVREILPGTATKKDGTQIKGKLLCYKISDCLAKTSTVFDKEIIQYNGFVYDLTLERNHIMYVQRNGRCFWGSNCLCMSNPITIQGEEKDEFYRRLAEGEDMSNYVSPNAVKDIPESAKAWIESKHESFVSAGERGKLGYVWRENLKYIRPYFSTEEQQRMGIALQQKKRIKTDEEKADIKRRWEERKKNNEILARGKAFLENIQDFPELKTFGLSEAISEKDYDRITSIVEILRPRLKFERSITPDILRDSVMRKKYGDEAVDALYANVKRTIKNNVDSLSSIDEKIKKLRFEADWVVNNRSFPTVKEVAAYYEREAARLEAKKAFDAARDEIMAIEGKLSKYGIKTVLKGDEWYGDIKTLEGKLQGLKGYEDKLKRIEKIADFAKTTKSPDVKAWYEGIENALKQDGLDANIDGMIEKAEKRIARLQAHHEQARQKKLEKLAGERITADDLKKALGDKCPLSIKDLQPIIDRYEAGVIGKYTDEEIEKFKVGMRKMFAQFDYGMNIQGQWLENCLDECFKNLIEVGHGNGSVDIPNRVRAAQNMFGFGDIKKGRLMEKYGSLLDKDMALSFTENGASGYGECIVRFKKDKVIATWTKSDSLCRRYQPSLTTDPKLSSLSRSGHVGIPDFDSIKTVTDLRKSFGWSDYIELQYHGNLTFDCVESLSFDSKASANSYAHLITRMKKLGVKVYYYDRTNKKMVEL